MIYRVLARFGQDVEVQASSASARESAGADLNAPSDFSANPDLNANVPAVKGGAAFRVSLRRQFADTVCGDQVRVDASGRVAERLPRKNQLLRRDGFQRLRTIAANIDTVWIVVTEQPETPNLFIDRFLVGIWGLPARAGVLWNKDDRYPLADSVVGQRLLAPYAHLDLPVLAVSARSGVGLPDLRAQAQGGTNILVGPSGVGKSALVQALLPDVELRIGELGSSGEGQHTTTQARWYQDSTGGSWIDSPGVRDFSPEILNLADLAWGFPDIQVIADGCRFRDCWHRNEPGCAVLAAVTAGTLPSARLEAWLRLSEALS